MSRDNFDLLNNKLVFLLDMDGTIYNEDHLFPGVIEFLKYLEDKKIRYYFLTNNSSKSTNDYLHKLTGMGIKATKDNLIISHHIAGDYLRRNYQDELVYVVGTKSMVAELVASGVHVTEEVMPNTKVVLVGNDNELTFKKLRDASYLLTLGAAFVATNVDRACPVSFGYVPDCGAICAMLTAATGRKPTYMGKPHAEIVNYLKDKTGVAARDIVMVGDRLYTDMLMAIKRRMTSILVLSGEATLEDVEQFPHNIDYVVADIATLLKKMRGTL